jgi:sulfur carrier protein ThiS
MKTITVRVGKLPGRIVEIALEDNRAITDALEIAELDQTGYEVRVNATPADINTELEDGDTVLLVKKVKGNTDDFITVRIGKLPGRIVEVALNGDRSVAAALEAAELDQAGYEVRVNATPADTATILEDGDTLLLVKKVKGN